MTWLLSLSTPYKWAFFAILFLAGMSSGIWIERLIFRSTEVSQLQADIAARDKQINGLQDEVKLQSDAAKEAAEERDAKQKVIDVFNAEREGTYENTPAIVTPCISSVRVRFNNSARAAANSIGAGKPQGN